ncbi:MAG: hypothetical protein A2161_09605 [Candidatus Schekmanbacteria bacterium RBG_13_48_7]|uniref:4Fe-4S ferredoxin-type domain-containing protein n=1 Tax=Candidatus Schekmanbacteria bacterium RBG_13_48_7 TaxID=1817878 RepID=A0A1F7RP50_9BACT|nr:MAG: hypothetical protein A2161_09605 [Candidatus Schekmanbacteria bacterium RBG_13_48_7]
MVKVIFILFLLLCIPDYVLAQQGRGGGNFSNIGNFIFSFKYISMAGFALICIVLMRLKMLKSWVRLLLMATAFFVFSFVFELHPSPVCATTKPFLFGLRTQFLSFLLVSAVLSFIATKGFCGSACPAGGFQELIYKLPVLKKLKRHRVPFIITNSIRTLVFLVFLFFVFGWKTNIYDRANLFEYLHLSFPTNPGTLFIYLIPFIIYVAASVISYRPFCAYVCPVGLWSWIVEQFSLTRVSLISDKCNQCKKCEKSSPCTAIYDIVAKKKVRAECFLCGVCLEVCPEDALKFGFDRE